MNLAIIWIFKTHLWSINVCARTNIVLNIPMHLQNTCVSTGLTNNYQKISEKKKQKTMQSKNQNTFFSLCEPITMKYSFPCSFISLKFCVTVKR